MKDFINRLATICLLLGIVVIINFACCDANKLNKNTKEIERKTDSIKAGKRFKRVDKGNGLHPKLL